MKRQNPQNNPKGSPPVRTSSHGAIRSSDNPFSSAKAGEPKTSEYAFFKKLKTKAGHGSQSRPLDKEESGSKLLGSSYLSNVDCSDAIKNSFNDLRLPIEPCLNPDLLLSPVVKVDEKKAATDFGDIYRARKSMEEYNIAGRPQGIGNQQEDLFSTKRRKLRQWVTDTAFPEIEELCSKRYDFVSVLLSRLLPQINEEYSFKIPESEQGESNTLLSWPHSNIHLKKPHYTSTRNVTEIEFDPYLEHYRDEAPTRSDSGRYYGHNSLLDNILRVPSYESGGIRNTIPWIEGGSVSSLSKKNRYLPPVMVEELDDSQYLDGSLFGREKHPLLLEWDSPNEPKERYSAVVSKNTELVTYSTPSTPWGSNHDPDRYKEYGSIGASELCVSSLIYNYHPNFYALAHSSSNRYDKHEFGSKSLGSQEEDTPEDFNNYPLALSHMPNYLCTGEDFHFTAFRGSRASLSPGNHHWFSSEVSSERHLGPGTEAHLSSELDFCLGRKFLSMNNSSNVHYSSIDPAVQCHQEENIFSQFIDEDKHANFLEFDSSGQIGVLNHITKNVVDICDWASFFPQIFPDKQKAPHLLLDKSSWDETTDICHDDIEIE
ncbi:uncharacterized protein LOC123215315 isoform X2 [Mangifera indica]|uniref:uncharacterized protein LOC123215315 isoform X2 n=1 Tax=Mangifera indica TaxID=29780 RepID=UPI001CFA0ACA|nr:uncharacterized protein LOC123215315 isoform X2 [Mangifera indica]